MINKYLVWLLGVLIIPVAMLVVSPTVSAGVNLFPACNGKASGTDVCQSIKPGTPGANPIINILKITISILSIVIGFAAVIMIILAGLAFVTANGDSQAIAKARGSIIYALVGVVIVAISQGLVVFVLNKL
jgi:hypothetical protein